jgi:hypothetical protein
MSEEHLIVQDSKYWKSWRALNVLSMQINIFSARIELDQSCALRSSQIDPYVVVFLSKDRSHSKKKTMVQKKTLSPIWNESLLFSNFDINDSICVEMKMPSWGTFNPVLASTTFTVDDLIRMSSDSLKEKTYVLQGAMPGVNVDISLGFEFDGNTDVQEKAHKVNDFKAREAHRESAVDPVYLNARGAFASFLFYDEPDEISFVGSQVRVHPENMGQVDTFAL